jgi:hypothetical protein
MDTLLQNKTQVTPTPYSIDTLPMAATMKKTDQYTPTSAEQFQHNHTSNRQQERYVQKN